MRLSSTSLVRVAALAGALLGAPATQAGSIDNPGIQAGNLLQFGVPLTGFALTFLLHDPGDSPASTFGPGDLVNTLRLEGAPRHDFLAAALRMELATYSLKYAVAEQRPNGGQHSFPSGHTASAFMGAEFIRKEYGWLWGAPAYAAAGYVGWSRVASHNHWPRDVYAGAAVGILSNHDLGEFTGRYGTISIGPALLSPRPAASGFGEEPSDDALRGADADAIGLQLNLKF